MWRAAWWTPSLTAGCVRKCGDQQIKMNKKESTLLNKGDIQQPYDSQTREPQILDQIGIWEREKTGVSEEKPLTARKENQ